MAHFLGDDGHGGFVVEAELREFKEALLGEGVAKAMERHFGFGDGACPGAEPLGEEWAARDEVVGDEADALDVEDFGLL